MADEYPIKRLESLIRHVEHVQSSCLIMGKELIENGEAELGHKLIANSYKHDNSKFFGIEWLYLNDVTKKESPDLFKVAWLQHVTTNLHHPEAWSGGIQSMSDEFLCEMLGDWKARSDEAATDLRIWIKDRATQKYGFSTKGAIYKKLRRYMNLLLEPNIG